MLKRYLAKYNKTYYTPHLMSDSPQRLHQQAIMAALSADWEKALELNRRIIELEPRSTDALNRLGRAYFELGDLTESKKNFQSSLEVDPYNQIAAKFVKRIETCSKKGAKARKANGCLTPLMVSDIFIEEPGKTKLVTLLKVAEPQKISLLSAGQAVTLIAKNRSLAVADQNGEYLGILPDDLSHHLGRLIRGGNKYQAFIKTIKTNGLSILIREIYRCPRFRNQPSFLDNINMTMAYSSDHIIMPDEGDEDGLLNSDEEETV